jgi:hypothetical protein
MPTPYEPFDGALDAARERLRRLAAAACQVLDARMLKALAWRRIGHGSHRSAAGPTACNRGRKG